MSEGFSLIRGRRLRATKVDRCGNPVLGPRSRLVTKGFITLTFTPNNETTDAITVTNASGEQCISEPAQPRFVNGTVAGTFCKVMPDLFSMLTGMPTVRSADDLEAIGIRLNSRVDIDASAAGLEVWSSVPQAVCGVSGLPDYGYSIMPFVKGGVLSGITWENGALTFGIEGATTRDGTAWAAGPYDVELDENGVPGPLNRPLDAYDHFEMIKVQVAPPEPTDGPVALGVPATGFTAGSPATPTPTNSYAPTSLTGLTGKTATPTTAWTTGQYVQLEDGSKAHWSGTAWVAGPA